MKKLFRLPRAFEVCHLFPPLAAFHQFVKDPLGVCSPIEIACRTHSNLAFFASHRGPPPLRGAITSIISPLFREPNHTQPNRLTLTLWIFQACFFCLPLRLERFRQRRELTADVLEEQPLLDDFGHLRFIARRKRRPGENRGAAVVDLTQNIYRVFVSPRRCRISFDRSRSSEEFDAKESLYTPPVDRRSLRKVGDRAA